ncbi:hypothetical protein HZA97_03790 [Candidatus Woesearchaeota archaeon]|nr:hypothetical protein [Candidatus Woesearchaeota archaeon]
MKLNYNRTTLKFALLFMALSILITSYIMKYSYVESSIFTVLFFLPAGIILVLPATAYTYLVYGSSNIAPISPLLASLVNILFYTLLGAAIGYLRNKFKTRKY